MEFECMNCGHIATYELDFELKCVCCDVYFKKFESRAKKLAEKQGISLEEYYEQTKPLREMKRKEEQLKIAMINEEMNKNKNKNKIAETVKSIQISNSAVTISKKDIKEILRTIQITTTDNIPGHRIVSVQGVVSTESICDKFELKYSDNINSEKVCDRNKSVLDTIKKSRQKAVKNLKLEVIKMKANAAVDVKFDYLNIAVTSIDALLIIATGTAVFIEETESIAVITNTLPDREDFHSQTNVSIKLNRDIISQASDLAYIADSTGFFDD
jgi:uncharacterized protein YbjQ (UPF0145 family)